MKVGTRDLGGASSYGHFIIGLTFSKNSLEGVHACVCTLARVRVELIPAFKALPVAKHNRVCRQNGALFFCVLKKKPCVHIKNRVWKSFELS